LLLCADKLLQQVLPHVLNGTAVLHSQLSNDSEARIQWYAAQAQPHGSFSTEHVEQFCMQLLSVLAQALFRQRPSTLREFGAAFWGPFVQQYQAAFLQQVQGSTVALLQARQEAARQMEQQAVAVGLAEPGELAAEATSAAATVVLAAYGDVRRHVCVLAQSACSPQPTASCALHQLLDEGQLTFRELQ
jgi:hypothetical protein